MQDRAQRGEFFPPFGRSRSSALQLLRERHADAVEHLNGTLLDHLERTERLLLAWDASDSLAIAGLCHAAYGTDGFAPVLLSLDERAVLASTVGPDVEATVYFYASCDRGFLYPRIGAGEWNAFRDRFTGQVFCPSMEQLSGFADLTLANETDVATRDGASTPLPQWYTSLVHEFQPLASRQMADTCARLVASAG